MKLNIIMLGIVLLCIALPSVMAADYVYKQYDPLDVKVPCVKDGGQCTQFANCTLTVMYPSGIEMIKDVLMTNQGSFHNYTLSGQQTSILGTYQAQTFCSDVGGKNGWSSFSYEINSVGATYSNILSNPLVLILVGIAILIFVMAIVLKNLYLSFISGGAFLLTGIYLVIYGLGQINDVYTRALGMIALAMGLYLGVGSAYDLIEQEGGNDSYAVSEDD